MLGLKNKQQLASDAHRLAGSMNLVQYRDITYLPVDYETKEAEPQPDADRTIWLPLTSRDIQRLAGIGYDTLFANDSELRSFQFMVSQYAKYVDSPEPELLVRTPKGLRRLDQEGELVEPDGVFLPNTLVPMLNDNKKDKQHVLDVISEWVDGVDEAHSLLRHLATCLSPGYSAIRYVLLLGGGRNGKSTLLKMVLALFGKENTSSVTRQDIAERSTVTCDLNGKLVNVVMDGPAEFLKDSGNEKSLIAGEHVTIRKLYESTPTYVQTNALFVEGLQHEPKSKDKSTALQKRLVRFQFPNTYPDDKKFERYMLQEKIVGAFLSVLIDHYVREDEVAEKLAPTAKAMELQLEHMYINSMALQFFKYLEEEGTFGVLDLLGKPITDIVPVFQSWRLSENDIGSWPEPDVLKLFDALLNTERKSVRTKSGPRKARVITSLKPEASAFIESLKEDDGGGNSVSVGEEAVVEIGSVHE